MAESNLLKCLNPEFCECPPTDVRFWFKDGVGGVTKDVVADTLILAAASNVFNREFYGSLKAEHDIEIKDASQELFLKMIEYIYNKKSDFKDASLSFLASLYYLGDKYNIKGLRDEIVAMIPEHVEIINDNVLEVALLAEDNILLEPLSEALYDAATAVCFVNKERVFMDLCADGKEEHAGVIFKILNRIGKLEESTSCKNCGQIQCLNGQKLTKHNFVKSATVIFDGRVTAVLIHNKKELSFRAIDLEGEIYNYLYNSFWVYSCKPI